MYLDSIAAAIRAHVPEKHIPTGNTDELFRLYAVLLRSKGSHVTNGDIHDAWSAWMVRQDNNHESLLPYDDLDEKVREQDRVFATAVRRAADELGVDGRSTAAFSDILFPSGPPKNDSEYQQTLDLYRVMVESSESLVGRRQAVNTFFLTINGALLTASGLIVKGTGADQFTSWGILVLALAGVILCLAWRSLITSFGQLNRGKFRVINTIEHHLKVAVYAAEWEALGRGEDPKIYRSFTSREIWVPNALLSLHSLAAITALFVATGAIALDEVVTSAPSTPVQLDQHRTTPAP
ncbi:MAG: hypothetical protein RBS39_06560 [Phycisphaerales bacterium]|jgi:hypothetical protein|nr:hypothetical protein [Phycisphaerales bacterium]